MALNQRVRHISLHQFVSIYRATCYITHYLRIVFSARGCPNEITITPVLSDRTKATLWWKFSGDDKDISKFLVEVDNQEGATVDPCYREASISELKPYVSHAVRVIAVFKDEYRTESKIIAYTIPTEDQSE